MDSNVTEAQRRDAVMKNLAAIAQRGIDAEARNFEKRIAAAPTSAFTPKWRRQIERLHTYDFNDTMLMLNSYNTETLEYVAANFAKPKNLGDLLHLWLSYGDDEWNTYAGEHRDAMLRDYISVRCGGFHTAHSEVHALLDVYRALDLAPGSIYLMSSKEAKTSVESVFLIASASRGLLRLRYKQTQYFDLPESQEARRVNHLREEVTKYLVNGSRQECLDLRKFMFKEKRTVPELDLNKYLEWAGHHGSLREGVL